MTRDETKLILMAIESAFPSWKPTNLSYTVDVWYMNMRDFDFKAMQAALRAYIVTDTKGFAPSIGQLIDKLAKPDKLSPLEAWSYVYNRMQCSIYYAKENFDTLPDTIKRAVGSSDVLRQWAMTDSSQITVLQANFIRAYNAELEREKDCLKIPADVRQMLETTAHKLIAGGNDNNI